VQYSIHFIIIDGMNSDIVSPKLRKTILGLLAFVLAVCIFSCKDKKPDEKDIVKKPEQLDDRVKKNLKETVNYAINNKGKINDTTELFAAASLRGIYEKNEYTAIWSGNGNWAPLGDSLYQFITNAKFYGLFPSDYFYGPLSDIHQQLEKDTLAKKDAALWSRADVMMTDALLLISQHLKRGRLPEDSLSSKKDSAITNDYYIDILNEVVKTNQLSGTLAQLEPKLEGYTNLKEGIKSFLDSVQLKKYTYLVFPFKDSIAFYSLLQKRLYEEKILDTLLPAIDTAVFRKALTRYQALKKLKTTGKVNENTIKALNDTNWEKYKRIALTLDKYKLMADTLPPIYVWVNLPSFNLKVVNNDSVVLESRVIVGASKTRTPELYSEISNFITYPQWTVPYSIIFKDMLPAIQKDTNYLKKQNLMVVDRNDSVIPPSKINWSKLNKNHFPYQIKQRQGDDNSLGVLKFNFRNKYSVYLHDTNARWLFSKSMRALSHGCVRVQNWKDLAHFLVRNDSIRYSPDTLTSWIGRQEKHVVSGFKKVPLFIRYFTCEGKEGRVRFYDDIYAEDKMLIEKYFSRNIN
jgi:murein L,D-transpeptidase YcbB/YkuD